MKGVSGRGWRVLLERFPNHFGRAGLFGGRGVWNMATIPPESISGLKAWSPNFAAKLSATPTAVGCTAADATAYAALNTDFMARVATQEDPATRTDVTTEALRTSRIALLAKARQLCKIINAYPGTTNTLRVSFGLHVRDVVPTPVPVPLTRPQLSIDPFGNLRIVDETTPDRRGKPTGVFAAVVYSKIGPATDPDPVDANEARFAGVATRGKFPIPLAPGSTGQTLWVMAQWINDKGQPGPISAVVRTLIAA